MVVGFRTADPAGYGRLIEEDGKLVAIREEKDCLRGGEEDRLLQWRPDGDLRQACAGAARPGRQRQRQGRILPHRHRRDRRAGAASRSSPPRPAPKACSASTTAPSSPRPKRIWQRRRRREAMLSGVTLIAPETVFFSHDTEIGAGHARRAECLLRPGREDRGRRDDPRLQPYRGRDDRGRLRGRPVRAAAAGRRARREGQGRQFLRGQEGDDRGGRQGQPPDLYRRRARRRRRQYRRRHHHLQL